MNEGKMNRRWEGVKEEDERISQVILTLGRLWNSRVTLVIMRCLIKYFSSYPIHHNIYIMYPCYC